MSEGTEVVYKTIIKSNSPIVAWKSRSFSMNQGNFICVVINNISKFLRVSRGHWRKRITQKFSFGLAHYLHVGISGTVIRSSDECRLAAQNNLFFLLESLLRKSIYHADFGFPDTVLVWTHMRLSSIILEQKASQFSWTDRFSKSGRYSSKKAKRSPLKVSKSALL